MGVFDTFFSSGYCVIFLGYVGLDEHDCWIFVDKKELVRNFNGGFGLPLRVELRLGAKEPDVCEEH